MASRHPLYDLIEDAERRWDDMNARQSKTLTAAVAEYVRRNGYQPPAGFDLWWSYTQKHDVKLVDEFDQINYDITPFLALSPRMFRSRVDAISDPSHAFHINVTNGHTNRYGPLWWDGDQRALSTMLMRFSRTLPDLVIHGHDNLRADSWIGDDLRQEASAKVRRGEYFTEEELQHFESIERNSHRNLTNVCLPDDPIFNVSLPSDAPKFVASHLTYMSPCSSLGVHHASPLLFTPEARPLKLDPHFVFSKHRPDSGFLLPTNTWDFFDTLLVTPHEWAERQDEGANKLYWRGPVTGWNWYRAMAPPESGITWRDGARAKLALSFSTHLDPGEEVKVLLEGGDPDKGLVTKVYKREWLNARWMDVGLTGSPIQCNVEEGTCDDMQNAPMWKEPYPRHKESRKKYTVDVDSNEWSKEFQRKLSAGLIVFKSTTYPEWYTQRIMPYYHYIPIQSDYSDVYNIMAFFLGDPETGIGGHEEFAEKISRHAGEYARKYWRWEDMQAYFYRLVLEYARLASEDREAASFRL
ncbi:hypothetical protein JB92DRAFT_3021783 [Gautieria morchelliformis]|nr:hypothetical protein JB92DRAFT_3021783 [Gautieria morchelliformis]